MELSPLATQFVTLFVIVDPIAVAPLFVALTQGLAPAERRAAAVRACLVAAGVLTVFGLFGETLLRLAGISLDAFRISGGMLLFLIAVEMLFERRTARRRSHASPAETASSADAASDDPSVFPIAVPLIAGPGAMATMVLLATQPGADWTHVVGVHAMMLAVIALTLALFLLGARLDRLLGASGINVLTRLFGILLAALAVQIVIDGMRSLGLAPA